MSAAGVARQFEASPHPLQPVSGLPRRLAIAIALLGSYAAIGGAVSFLGWVLDLPRLTDWNGQGISIQPNTTIAVTASGVALLCFGRGRRRSAAIAGALVALIGGSVLFQYLAGVGLGIDSLLLFDRTWGRVGALVPGRMGPPGATSWTLLGIALVLAAFRPESPARKLVPVLGIATAGISSLSLIGYLYGASVLFTIPTLTVIALQTATFILAVSLGVLMAVPERGPLRLLRKPGPASLAVRFMLPAVVLVPIVLGFLRLAGDRARLYDPEFGSALRTVAEIALFLLLLWWSAAVIQRHSRRREEAAAALQTSRAQIDAELADTRLLQRISVELVGEEDVKALYDKILDAAVGIMRSDFGSMQRIESRARGVEALRLIAARGFDPASMSAWEWIGGDSPCSCGVAFREFRRTVVSDVTKSESIAATPELENYLRAGIHSMQSTPLVSRGGKLVGMISTHWRTTHTPSERDLRLFDILARQAADLLERKRAEDTLRERQAMSNEAQRLAHVGSWEWDAATDSNVISDELCRIFGLPECEPVPDFADQDGTMYPHESWLRLDAAVRESLRTGVGYTLELEALRKGERIWITTRGEVIRDPTGRIVGMRGSVQDLTERAKIERIRDQALERERAAREEAENALQAKDEFLATLSHELRTPLNAVLGWATLLKRDAHDPQRVAYAAEVIERNGWLQTQLITDLLDMSRIVSGKMRLDVQRVDLPRVIGAAIESVQPGAEAKGVRIEQVLDPLPGEIHGDPARLQQVVWNLLSNAVKFTPRGGRVQVVLARVASHVEMRVSDTGIGIAPEFLPHLFERFRQADASASRQHGGLGIGLALVKQLVELHGGRVRASSDGKGKGSTFVVELPVAILSHEERARVPVHPKGEAKEAGRTLDVRLTGIKALVVDDEPDALALVRRLLEDAGAIVKTALSSEEALVVLGSETFDVIVSDIGMPGFDGYALLAEIRSRGVRTPALALTAFARVEDRARSLHSGYQAHVSKPIATVELLTTVASLVNRASSAAGASSS